MNITEKEIDIKIRNIWHEASKLQDAKKEHDAIFEYTKAIALAEKYNFWYVVYLYVCRGKLYSSIGKDWIATENYTKGLAAYSKYPNCGLHISDKANLLCNRSISFLGRGQYHHAIKDATEALTLLDETKKEFKKSIAEIYKTRAHAYAGITTYKKALADYKKALDLAKYVQDDNILGFRINIYQTRAFVYEKLNMFDKQTKDLSKVRELKKRVKNEQ